MIKNEEKRQKKPYEKDQHNENVIATFSRI